MCGVVLEGSAVEGEMGRFRVAREEVLCSFRSIAYPFPFCFALSLFHALSRPTASTPNS